MLWVPAAPAAASIALVFGFGRSLDDFGRRLPARLPARVECHCRNRESRLAATGSACKSAASLCSRSRSSRVWAFIVFVRVDIRMPAQRRQHHVLGQLLAHRAGVSLTSK